MTKRILNELRERNESGRKSLAVLIDPDTINDHNALRPVLNLARECCVDYFFVGGSLITHNSLSATIQMIRAESEIPVILFPGNNMQIDLQADGILFLSLISGRNPELLIGQHVVAAPILKGSTLEILPTGYLLVGNERNSSVAYMSNTNPIPSDKFAVAASTAMAGEMLGLQLIYLDGGSGVKQCIQPRMIMSVKKNIHCPLIVGGGIDTKEKARTVLRAGADVIVVGNALERDPNLLIPISEAIYEANQVRKLS